MSEAKKAEKKRILLYITGVGMGIGSELIALSALGLWLGKWVDQKFSLNKVGTLFCFLFFLGCGLVHIVYVLIQMQKKLESLKEGDNKL